MRRFAPFALFAASVFGLSAPAAATLPVGAKAPDFTTRGAIAGKVIGVHFAEQLRHGPVVLYFFPAAFTSGCNAEAHAFAEAIDRFKAAGASVIGLSADPVDVLAKFSTQKCAGKFAVASAGPKVVAGYDVAYPKAITGPDGKPRAITTRTSYVIGRDGRVAFVHDDMDASRHVELTLAAVQRLGQTAK